MPNFKTSTWVIIGLVVFILWRCLGSSKEEPKATPTSVPAPPPRSPTTYEKIDAALLKTVYEHQDKNGDGLVNCIDYALTFKKYYPEAEIMYVKSADNKEAHLFNRVDGLIVEPQLVNGRGKILDQYKFDMSTMTVKSVEDVYARRW